MDPSQYKDFKTSRGITYHYYFSAPQSARPTIFFAHGLPCTSAHWHKQVTFFKNLGYGIIAPDLLGYGGTDKPTDHNQYRMKDMVADAVEIIDNEHVDKIIAIGHDWQVLVTPYKVIAPLLSFPLGDPCLSPE